MVKRWNSYEIQLSCIMVLAILAKIQKSESLNVEGLALLEFRERIENDPHQAFANWNPNHSEPCVWLGVQCLNGKVKMLVMSNNRLSGSIPREIGELKLLEVLDLKHNNFSGKIPLEIGGMSSLKCMSLCGNDLLRDNPPTIGVLDYLLESGAIEDSYRRHLAEQSSNLVVVPTKVIKVQQKESPIIVLTIKRYSSAKVVQAQNASLLHRLSKVFVTGVPALNSSELQTACEDFSNIIDTFSGCLMYKGILSTGVEIAVLSTSIRSSQQWSNFAEREFKRKMDTFSKINHKNFINLLGHCEEDNPFVRMMVFEYAPNGNLYEHLHVKDIDHLDWTTRMRIIMGTCYCLEYMHHELNPPVVHPNLQSDTILLTDDYAAKVADVSFWADIVSKAKISDDEELEPLHSNPGPTCEDNVYSLGILLLEIISTKSLNAQAIEYLKDKKKYCNLVDPSLKSFKNNELEIICEVIHECLNEDPRRRPTLKDVTSKLQAVIKITPEAASARHSPLWWAELEILSIESG
uniref:Protein kinase domain-containing protein n=1 Tax=Chenopodium quinoa TaxID=63459 RepID=A0A803LVT1_CHEQI